MSVLKGFRQTSSKNELNNCLKIIEKEFYELTCWQTKDDDKNVFKAFLKDHQIAKNDFYLELEIQGKSNILDGQLLFIHCEENKTLIKAKIKFKKKNILKLKIDRKFYLEEKRANPRYDILQKNISMHIFRKNPITAKINDDNVVIKDITNQGCGFVISASRATIYKQNMEVTIDQIGSEVLEHEITGRVTHVTPISSIGGVNENSILVGIFFDLSLRNIDHILQKIEIGTV